LSISSQLSSNSYLHCILSIRFHHNSTSCNLLRLSRPLCFWFILESTDMWQWSSASALLLCSGCEHILILVVIVILWFPLIQFNVYFLGRVCCFSVRCRPCCSSRLEVEVEMLSNGGYRNEWKITVLILFSLFLWLQKVIRKEFKLLFYEVDTAFLPSDPRMQFRFFGFLR